MAIPAARATGGLTLPPELCKHDVELWSRAGLGRAYLLVGRARAGSFGTVFRARVGEQDADVAVKVVSPSRGGGEEALYDAFAKVSRLAQSLGDEAVLVPTTVGRGQGVAYKIEPWLAGGSVADLLQSSPPLPTDRIIAILRAAAGVLDRAHARGVPHRALRPGNLLFDRQGRLRIADFGADQLLYAAGAQRAGASVTVQAYDAPEARRGTGADGRSDQFSLAVIAYELLSGQRRVDLRGVEGIPTVAPLEIDAYTPVRPGLGLHVNRALRTALGAGAANRFSTVGAFVDALEGRMASVAGEKTVRYRFTSFRPRVTAMLLVVLGGVATAAAYLDPGTTRAARSGWRSVAGSLGRPIAAPTGSGVTVAVVGPEGRAMPSAPEPRSGDHGRPRTAALPTAASSVERSAGPVQPASEKDLPPELAGGTSRQETVTKRVAGRRLASSAVERALAPGVSSPAREAAAVEEQGSVTAGAGAFVRGFLRKLVGQETPSGATTSTSSGGSESAPAAAATFITVEAGGAALVTVDGIPRGAAPTTIRVSPGRHSVAVHAPDITYKQSSTTVVVARGTTTAVTFSPSSQRP